MSAQSALRSAIFACLRAYAPLTAIVGANRVYDGAPRATALPFVDLLNIESRLLAADPDEGERHRVDLLAISDKTDRGEAADAISVVRDALNGAGNFLSGHHLVLLSDPVLRTERLRNGRGWRGRLRITFITEPSA